MTITATSVADPTKSGTAIANVMAPHDNQAFQNPPVKLGTSGGNATDKTTSGNKIYCCSGTLGSLVSRGGGLYILSNNHVLDKSDQAAIGDPISQPGLADTNCGQNPNTIVANLSQAAPLRTSNVDAAIAKVAGSDVDQNGTILDLAGPGNPAPPSAILAAPAVDQGVAKSGDASGLTCSTVNAINALIRVNYSTSCQDGTSFSVTFDNQVVVSSGSFSNNGDSGSLIVTSDTARPVALLYAGNDTSSTGNPIQDVLTALKDPSSGEIPKIVGGGDHPVGCPAGAQAQMVAREKALTVTALPEAEIARATAVKNLHAVELMQDPAVTGVGVAQSEDNPAESAIAIFVTGQPGNPIPAQIDGVRTKIIMGSEFQPRQSMAAQNHAIAVSEAEIAKARTAKQNHAQELMANAAVYGLGVGASSDNPAESALVVFAERGKPVTVPAVMDGIRTRVVVGTPFSAFRWGKVMPSSCSAAKWRNK